MRRCPCALLLSALLLSAPASPAAERRPVLVEPAFGETLYAFYQKQYFDAISRLLVARERGELKRQAAEGELLLGGLYVQYDMPTAAQEIFGTLLPADDSAPQVKKIWMALAELNYRRDRYPETLAIVEQHFPRRDVLDDKGKPALPDDAMMLAVKSLMRMGRYREAVEWLGPSVSDLPEGRYLRFNVAAALINDGDAESGAALLQGLLAAPADDEEFRALRDRTALALASTRLQQQRAADAFAAIAQAQLDGPYSNEAMLVYGISALRNGNPVSAIRALLPLSKHSPHEQAVQEGWVALGQSYDAANDEKRAIAAFRDGLQKLNAELGYLQKQEQTIASGAWFSALAQRADDIALRDDRVGLSDRDVLAMPLHYRMFASHRFVTAFAQYIEVSRLAQLAVDWEERIPVLDYLVQSRVERHERLALQARQLLADTEPGPYAQRQQVLAAQAESTIGAGDTRMLATADQQRLLDFAATAAAKMDAWPQHDWSDQKKKLELLRGELSWEMARNQPLREWDLRHAVRDNGRLVDESGELRARVQKAAVWHMANVDGWRQQMREEDAQLKKLAKQSAGLRDGLRTQMEQDARDTINARRERIVQLAADAWFGIAQIEQAALRARRDAQLGKPPVEPGPETETPPPTEPATAH